MNIPTLGLLENTFQHDLAWRRKELSSLYLSAIGAKTGSDAQLRAIRSGIVLTYAHVEGFARLSIRAYFAYVRSRSLKYSELGLNFLALKISRMVSQGTAKASYYEEAVTLLVKEIVLTADLPEPEVISARSNLSYAQLREMLFCINLDASVFATKEHFLDSVLLERRNAIAHGEFRRPSLNDYLEVHRESIEIIDTLHDLLVISAIDEAFRI